MILLQRVMKRGTEGKSF